ncbi:MAG TPA: ABC transporter substrate-binding protein [Burkholderiales bacterium]|nr:ABC transporter substrate-binding protein [Burkholderiales bacterium]
MIRLYALALAASAMIAVPAFGQEREMKFTLDFIPLGRHAPWYVAVAKGYYKEEGLTVSIVPARGTADSIRALDSGVVDMGFIDIPSLVAAGADSSTIRMVAVNYQRPPYSVFSLNPGANITRPQDMVGKEFSAGNASLIPRIHQAFMKQNGLDPSTLKVVNLDPASLVAALAAKRIQSIGLFAMSETAIRRAVQDAEVKHMLLADHGLDIYANGIGVKEDFLQKNPDVVRRFVRASLRGWKDALANPEEAAKLQLQSVKALNPVVIAEELQVVRRLAVVPDTQKNGLGWIELGKLKRTVDFINENFDVAGRRLSAEDIYRPGYLPRDPIRP